MSYHNSFMINEKNYKQSCMKYVKEVMLDVGKDFELKFLFCTKEKNHNDICTHDGFTTIQPEINVRHFYI